jgi:hypothetical protein
MPNPYGGMHNMPHSKKSKEQMTIKENRLKKQAERSRAWRQAHPERRAALDRRSRKASKARRQNDRELYRELYGI